jgi:hypothetical protein
LPRTRTSDHGARLRRAGSYPPKKTSFEALQDESESEEPEENPASLHESDRTVNGFTCPV